MEILLVENPIRQVKEESKGMELAIACARAADEIQAEDVRILDLRGLSSLTDFMVVCSGSSMPHLKAISREVSKGVSERVGQLPSQTEGKAVTRWVVLDYFDVMVHVLHEEMRELYALEGLWGDAKEVAWSEATSAAE
jgi:ribosome-associated protein